MYWSGLDIDARLQDFFCVPSITKSSSLPVSRSLSARHAFVIPSIITSPPSTAFGGLSIRCALHKQCQHRNQKDNYSRHRGNDNRPPCNAARFGVRATGVHPAHPTPFDIEAVEVDPEPGSAVVGRQVPHGCSIEIRILQSRARGCERCPERTAVAA